MTYIENPKTKGSGIVCCIPQTSECPMKCSDCFFSSGRSYLNPIKENLPNIPSVEIAKGRVVRMNDGNDSNVDRDIVMACAKQFKDKFYNTSIPKDLEGFDAPVVLTLNPAGMTDKDFHKLDMIPRNLMFVRFRTNMWNIGIVGKAIEYYTEKEVSVVLTFMAYYNDEIPEKFKHNYIYRKRTLNDYWAITTDSWHVVMDLFEDNILVYSCGRIEGEKGKTSCKYCGNCLREYYSTTVRMGG